MSQKISFPAVASQTIQAVTTLPIEDSLAGKIKLAETILFPKATIADHSTRLYRLFLEYNRKQKKPDLYNKATSFLQEILYINNQNPAT